MADLVPDGVLDEECAFTDFNSLTSETGGWLGQQGAYSESGYTGHIQHQGTSNGIGAQASVYPVGPLLHAPYSTPYPINAPSASVGRVASDPFAPFNSLDHLPHSGLSAEPSSIPITSYAQDEALTQAQVDESFRMRCSAPDPVDHHHLGTNSTPDGGFDHEMMAPRQLGQHASTNRDSRAPGYVGYTAAVHYGLFEGSGNSEPPRLLHEATALQSSPQLVVTPAPPSPQRYPFGQPAFGQDTHGHVYPLPEPESPSVYYGAFLHQGYFAGADLHHHATDQGYGGQNDDNYSVTSQGIGEMPLPVQHQRRRGPQPSYEAWSNRNSGPSQPTFGYTPAATDQSPSASSFAHGSDVGAASGRIPLSQHLAYNMGHSPGPSAPSTQQLTPGSNESNMFDWSSISATTPSHGEVISPSSADPARPFVCEEPKCKRKGKGFKTRADLRKHKETYNREKMTRHKCRIMFCDEGFRYPNDRDNHENSFAHGGSGVQCPYCRKRLSRKDNLVRHSASCPSAAGNQ